MLAQQLIHVNLHLLQAFLDDPLDLLLAGTVIPIIIVGLDLIQLPRDVAAHSEDLATELSHKGFNLGSHTSSLGNAVLDRANNMEYIIAEELASLWSRGR